MFTYRAVPCRYVFDEPNEILCKYGERWDEEGVENQLLDMLRVVDETIGKPLWQDSTWQEMMKHSVDEDDDDEERFLYQIYACGSAEVLKRDEYSSMRMILIWCMIHRVDALEALLDKHVVHPGRVLFPKLYGVEHYRPNLLGMAAIDVQSADVVRMLIARGADARGVLNMGMCDIMGAVCGAEAVAQIDARGAWQKKIWKAGNVPSPSTAAEVMQALLEGGSEWCGVYSAYTYSARKSYPKDVSALTSAARARETAHIKQRFENVVAIVGIVSFWRRLAASPDGSAAQKAAKRFRAAANA